MATIVTKPSYQKPLVLFILSASLVVLLLFYIDEGNYSLEGFKEPVHWLVFFIYLIPTVVAQLLIYRLLTKMNLDSGKLLFSVICGLFIGIVGVITAFYLMK